MLTYLYCVLLLMTVACVVTVDLAVATVADSYASIALAVSDLAARAENAPAWPPLLARIKTQTEQGECGVAAFGIILTHDVLARALYFIGIVAYTFTVAFAKR